MSLPDYHGLLLLGITSILGVFLLAFDFQNLLSWRRNLILDPAREDCMDFTIVVPVYGNPRYFAERHELAHLKANVLVGLETTPKVMQDFADLLESEGWRVMRCTLPAPSPPDIILAALHSGMIETAYTIRMDADTHLRGDLPKAIEAMRVDGADICSVKVRVHNPRSVAQKMQSVEYDMAMLSRHFRPWLTSGACIIAKTVAFRRVLELHSLWFPGEDLETGRIAFARKLRVRHLELEVSTAAPETWRTLFMQRRLWWAGSFRHTIINADINCIHTPTWAFYYLALVWFGLLTKWWSFTDYAASPDRAFHYLPWLFGSYTVIVYVTNWQVRSRWMLLMPYYALLQCMLMPIVGSTFYALLAVRKRRLGRYRFGIRKRRFMPELLPVKEAS